MATLSVTVKTQAVAPDREKYTAGCGDASACLKLRIPLTRDDRELLLQE
jgi:hypothetical protein